MLENSKKDYGEAFPSHSLKLHIVNLYTMVVVSSLLLLCIGRVLTTTFVYRRCSYHYLCVQVVLTITFVYRQCSYHYLCVQVVLTTTFVYRRCSYHYLCVQVVFTTTSVYRQWGRDNNELLVMALLT